MKSQMIKSAWFNSSVWCQTIADEITYNVFYDQTLWSWPYITEKTSKHWYKLVRSISELLLIMHDEANTNKQTIKEWTNERQTNAELIKKKIKRQTNLFLAVLNGKFEPGQSLVRLHFTVSTRLVNQNL